MNRLPQSMRLGRRSSERRETGSVVTEPGLRLNTRQGSRTVPAWSAFHPFPFVISRVQAHAGRKAWGAQNGVAGESAAIPKKCGVSRSAAHRANSPTTASFRGM